MVVDGVTVVIIVDVEETVMVVLTGGNVVIEVCVEVVVEIEVGAVIVEVCESVMVNVVVVYTSTIQVAEECSCVAFPLALMSWRSSSGACCCRLFF